MLPLSFGWRYLSSKVTLDPRLSVSRNPTEGNPAVLSSNILRKSSSPGAPLTYFNDGGGGGGGGRMILLSLKFWPKVIFWVYERRWDFFWLRKKQSDFWGLRKKVLRDFFGYAKNGSDFIWQTNSEVVISLGIKYEPLSDPPTLVVKICEWAPWELSLLVHRIAHKTIVTSKQYHNFTRFRKKLETTCPS